MKDYEEFENWWILQSKMPYRSQKEVAEMAFEAGRATIRELIAERDALLAKLALYQKIADRALSDVAMWRTEALRQYQYDVIDAAMKGKP